MDDTVNREYRIKFSYVNAGETAAKILKVSAVVLPDGNPWNHGAREVRFEEITPSKTVLKCGEETTDATSSAPTAIKYNSNREHEVWGCMGVIEYADSLGTVRKTGFYRRWNPKTMNWDKTGDEEYEYSF
jgi:hypothetical protein